MAGGVTLLVFTCAGAEKFLRDVEKMIGSRSYAWSIFWSVMWRILTPATLVVSHRQIVLVGTHKRIHAQQNYVHKIVAYFLVYLQVAFCIPVETKVLLFLSSSWCSTGWNTSPPRAAPTCTRLGPTVSGGSSPSSLSPSSSSSCCTRSAPSPSDHSEKLVYPYLV